MSQIYKGVASSPSVPIQFTADDATIAVPAANNLNVFSRDTIANNTNGIETTASPNGSDNLYIQLTNRISVSTTTSDATPTSVAIMTPTNGTSMTFTLTLTAYDSANNVALGGEQIGLVRKAAGVVTVIGTNDTFDEYDVALAANDWEIAASAGNLVLTVTGIAGHTLDWQATFVYIQVS